jgi:hypothetical protein
VSPNEVPSYKTLGYTCTIDKGCVTASTGETKKAGTGTGGVACPGPTG